MLQVKQRQKEIKRGYDKRIKLVKHSLYSLDNYVDIVENDNKYLYDMEVTLDNVEFGVSVRSGNFEKTKGYIEYEEQLERFIDRLTMPIIIFYVNKSSKDVFVSSIVNYELGKLVVKDKVVKRTLTQRVMDRLKDEINTEQGIV